MVVSRAVRIISLFALAMCVIALPARADWATDSLYKTNGVPYMLYVPPNYDPTNSYPLIMFLHGAGGEGTNNEASHVWNGASGKNSWVAMGTTFVLAPQGPTNGGWAYREASEFEHNCEAKAGGVAPRTRGRGELPSEPLAPRMSPKAPPPQLRPSPMRDALLRCAPGTNDHVKGGRWVGIR